MKYWINIFKTYSNRNRMMEFQYREGGEDGLLRCIFFEIGKRNEEVENIILNWECVGSRDKEWWREGAETMYDYMVCKYVEHCLPNEKLYLFRHLLKRTQEGANYYATATEDDFFYKPRRK